MIKEIVKDTEFLSQKSERFDFKKDNEVVANLLDTARSHDTKCWGLAAVQIGSLVKCFVARDMTKKDMPFVVYINPIIMKRSTEKYETEEGCLSLEGTRKVIRNRSIDVIYEDTSGKNKKVHLTGLTAEIVQHEYDHLQGKLI